MNRQEIENGLNKAIAELCMIKSKVKGLRDASEKETNGEWLRKISNKALAKKIADTDAPCHMCVRNGDSKCESPEDCIKGIAEWLEETKEG